MIALALTSEANAFKGNCEEKGLQSKELINHINLSAGIATDFNYQLSFKTDKSLYCTVSTSSILGVNTVMVTFTPDPYDPDGNFRYVSIGFSEMLKNCAGILILDLTVNNSITMVDVKYNFSTNKYKDTKTRESREKFCSAKANPPSIQATPKLPTEKTPYPEQSSKTIKQFYSGTGFMFGSKDYVITNWHVVRNTNNINVKFLNGEKIKAEVVLKDAKNDIAFLKLEESPQLPASSLKVGNSSNVRMGDKVFTIGYPAHWVMGKNPKYTEGVINALSGIRDDPKVFQISVQIQPGNSGGPLFNQSGEVIGITQASLDPQLATESIGALPQNVNYAIKSSYIKKLFPMLPETLVSNRGIVVVPTDPKNSLANFIDNAKNNIVLIEASAK
tara:strand:- start:5248 stop:6414 length:1167 start_codon:yes stop_codon:yes gene_type:complete